MAAVIGIGLSIAGANTAPKSASASTSTASSNGDCTESICVAADLVEFVEPVCASKTTVRVFRCNAPAGADDEAETGGCVVDYADARVVSARYYEMDCSGFQE